MSDALDKLAGTLLELCPKCQGRANQCRNCWDAGYVLHRCGSDAPPVDPEIAQVLNKLRAEKREGK